MDTAATHLQATGQAAGQTVPGDLVSRVIDADGSARHAHLRRLLMPYAPQRDLSDAVHALCHAHGRHPGFVDEAAARAVQHDAAEWLDDAARGFAHERIYLAALTAAAGPLPSTPGQAETEAAITVQRHAFEMLARSDRSGCATGAVAALLLDWQAIRSVLDAAAIRFGVTSPPLALPPYAETATVVVALATTPACERAIGFGAQQLLAQHRGLWGLIEARAEARDRV